jgi:hypothetical protein
MKAAIAATSGFLHSLIPANSLRVVGSNGDGAIREAAVKPAPSIAAPKATYSISPAIGLAVEAALKEPATSPSLER